MANELTVVSENDKKVIMGVLGGGLAQDIEFNSLDSAIEKIAEHTSDLSDSERNAAIDIVAKFESRVVMAIERKERTLSEFAYFLKNMSSTCFRFDYLEKFERYSNNIKLLLSSRSDAEELEEQFQDIMDAIETYYDHKEDRPEEPLIDHDIMTGLQVNRLTLEYKLALQRYTAKLAKEEYAIRKKFSAFYKAFKKNAEMKKFMKALEEQADASQHAKAIVEEKAAAARLNILVGNADIREALKEFHDFASSIA